MTIRMTKIMMTMTILGLSCREVWPVIIMSMIMVMMKMAIIMIKMTIIMMKMTIILMMMMKTNDHAGSYGPTSHLERRR